LALINLKKKLIIVIGGDGFMLQTLKKNKSKKNILWNQFWKLWFFDE
jgi:hypothetical protein